MKYGDTVDVFQQQPETTSHVDLAWLWQSAKLESLDFKELLWLIPQLFNPEHYAYWTLFFQFQHSSICNKPGQFNVKKESVIIRIPEEVIYNGKFKIYLNHKE